MSSTVRQGRQALPALLLALLFPALARAQQGEWITEPGPPAPGARIGPAAGAPAAPGYAPPAAPGYARPPAAPAPAAMIVVQLQNNSPRRAKVTINGVGPDLLPGAVLSNQLPAGPNHQFEVNTDDGRRARRELALEAGYRYRVIVGGEEVVFERMALATHQVTSVRELLATPPAGPSGDPFAALVFTPEALSGTTAFPTPDSGLPKRLNLGFSLVNGLAEVEDDVIDELRLPQGTFKAKTLKALGLKPKVEIGFTRIDLNGFYTFTPEFGAGLGIPILFESQEARAGTVKDDDTVTGLGDLFLPASYHLIHKDRLDLGLHGWMELPTADQDFYLADGKFALGLGFSVGYQVDDALRADGTFTLIAGNGGVAVRLGGGVRYFFTKQFRGNADYALTFTTNGDLGGAEGVLTLGASYLLTEEFALNGAVQFYLPSYAHFQRTVTFTLGVGYSLPLEPGGP